MFNPLKMAGDLKGMEKMLKPALDKFMRDSGFVKESELSPKTSPSSRRSSISISSSSTNNNTVIYNLLLVRSARVH